MSPAPGAVHSCSPPTRSDAAMTPTRSADASSSIVSICVSMLFATGFPLLAAGCGTPPLPGTDSGGADDAPSIRFIFPTSELSRPVCPDFFVAVDIDGFEVVPSDMDAEPVPGQGHWHLDDDITGDYYVVEDPFLSTTADLGGNESRNYRLTASLVNVNHSPLSLATFPASVDTVEFEVADVPDCLGGEGTGSTR